MPSLKLIPRQKDRPIPDEFRALFRDASVGTLIADYNSGIGCTAWVRARAEYLFALREALLATGLDCSSFIFDDGMSLGVPGARKGRRIVPIEEDIL